MQRAAPEDWYRIERVGYDEAASPEAISSAGSTHETWSSALQ